MGFAPAYLIGRFFYRIRDFFHHWYVDGSRALLGWFVGFFGRLDQTFALTTTIRYFFQPLYKDYSIVGRVLGVIFRLGRIAIGTAVYLFHAVIFAALYVLWLAIPPALLLYGIFR